MSSSTRPGITGSTPTSRQLETANTTGFQKIRRYFQNVAIWLAPKARQSTMLSYSSFWTVLSNAAFEELTIGTPILTLGGQAIDILGRKTSDCLVTSWLIDLVPIELVEVFRPRWPCRTRAGAVRPRRS